jgi:plastocyanin
MLPPLVDVQKGPRFCMSFARSVLAVGLILAALSSTARAQEADEFAAAEVETEYVEYVEYVEPQAAAPIEAPAPVEVVAPIVQPTAVPTALPTPAPTATPAAAVPAGKLAAVVIDNRFQPGDLSVPVRTTVTWTNNGFNFHTLSTQDAQFNSGALGGGQSFSFTFQQAGNYVLICRQHVLNGMTGRITVQ